MFAGSEFQVDDAETEHARVVIVKSLVIPGPARRIVFLERTV